MRRRCFALVLALALGVLMGICQQAAAAPTGGRWDLSQDFRVAPSQANPSPDRFGHDGVWSYMAGPGNDPSRYRLLTGFSTHKFHVEGLQSWWGTYQSIDSADRLPAIGINATGAAVERYGVRWPAGAVLVHPLADQAAVIAWQSPSTGYITIDGMVQQPSSADCGNGVAWTLRTRDTVLRKGSVSASELDRLTVPRLQVARGNWVYLVIDSKGDDFACDSTFVGVAIRAVAPAKPYDFNGDGYPELAIGAPGMRIGSVRNAGGVVVLPASAKGLSLREKIISQSSRGVPGTSERGDAFGAAVASADFDRDGYADLAVGQPGEAIGRAPNEGRVTVIYGSRTGLDTTRSATFTRPGRAGESDELWGYSLAAADLNLDGYPDLAVGAPFVSRARIADGIVGILPGGPHGLTSSRASILYALPFDENEDLDRPDVHFGEGLSTGDVDGDGDVDLVLLSAGDSSKVTTYAGSVSLCLTERGGPSGCTQVLHDYAYNGFRSVAVGNMSGDRLPEIVVGLPDDPFDDSGSGSVLILHLSFTPEPTYAQVTRLRKSSAGVPGDSRPGDRFGASVAMGDVDKDGYADLVVGAPGDNGDRGRVTVIHGARTGWRTTGNYSYSQRTAGIPGTAEPGDLLGASVTLLDHNRGGHLDLTIGAPGENGSGAITTLRGSGSGFTTKGARTFGLATLNYRHPRGAAFGATLGR